VTFPKGYKPTPKSNKKIKPYKQPRFTNLKIKLIAYGIAGVIIVISTVVTVLFR